MIYKMVRRSGVISAVISGLAVTATMAETTIKIEEGAGPQFLQVLVDSAVVLESADPFGEVFIANPSIADISTISGNTLYVLGNQPGRTTLVLINQDTSVMSTIDVRVEPDVSELKGRLSQILPGEEIEVILANDGLVLSGEVSSQETIEKAIELAGHYAEGRVSNLLTLSARKDVAAPVVPQPQPVEIAEPPKTVDPAAVEARIRDILPDELVTVHQIGGSIVLSGNVSSEERAQQALQIARLAAEETDITNLLSVQQSKSCSMRTRRAGEVVETIIPCGDKS